MKQTISLGAAAAVVIATIFVYVHPGNIAPHTISVFSPATVVLAPIDKPAAATPQSTTTITTVIANAALTVGTTMYPISVSAGETVIEAMRALSSTDTFTFTGRDYPSLGFFIDSINGKANANGMYWMLYINGVSASAGASSVIVKPSDTILWRYEKGY